MNRWQAIDGSDVTADDWQLAVPVVQKTPAQQSRINRKIFPTQAPLNHHFP